MGDWGTVQWNVTASVIAAVATAVAAFFAAVSARASRGMVQEMEKDRIAASQPVILLNFEIRDGKVWLRVANHGGPAERVHFVFDPLLINSRDQHVGARPFLGEGVPVVQPGFDESLVFDEFANYFDPRFYLRERITAFRVTVYAHDPATRKAYQPRTMDVSLLPLAPYPPAAMVYPALVTEGRGWLHGAQPTEADLVEFEATKEFLVAEGLQSSFFDQDIGWLRGEFTQRAWQLVTEPFGGLIVVALKVRGPYQSSAVKAEAWSYAAAQAFALRRAIEVDRDRSSAV